MTATRHSTRRKLSLLQLAEELGNVSKACALDLRFPTPPRPLGLLLVTL